MNLDGRIKDYVYDSTPIANRGAVKTYFGQDDKGLKVVLKELNIGQLPVEVTEELTGIKLWDVFTRQKLLKRMNGILYWIWTL